jgi:RNA polymerase sigma factor (sigma-70 family)
MDAHPDPLSPEALLAHSDWVRALAGRLVADPARADDIAQQAWVAALESPPRDARNMRGWLSAIVRNTARDMGRAESRRAKREERAARPEATPSTADLVQRATLQREVVDRVLALEEPYKTVVLLRWFEGLSPREIAQRTQRPIETVTTQLARAHEKLRERLDREWGSRDGWCVAFVDVARKSLVSTAVLGTSTTLGIGAWLMATSWKVGLAGVAIAIAVLYWWPDRGLRGPEINSGGERSPETASLEAPSSGQRTNVSEESDSATIYVVDSRDRTPIAQASIEIALGDRVDKRVADSKGVCVIGRPELMDATVTARANGYFPGGLLPTATRDAVLPARGQLEIELHPSGVLAVHVVDENSDPIPLVHINVRPDGLQPGELGLTFWPAFAGPFRNSIDLVSERYRLSWTRFDGFLELDDLPCDVPLIIEADDQVPKTSLRVTIPSSTRRADLTIRASRTAVLTGTLQWDDGSPAADVKVRNLGAVAAGAAGQPAVSTETGKFTLRGMRYGENAIMIVAAGQRARPVLIKDAESDVGTIVLTREVEVSGRVRSKCAELGLPVGPLQLSVYSNGESVVQVSVAPTGSFKLRLPRGAHVFEFLRAKVPFHSVSIEVPCVNLEIDADQFCGRLEIVDGARLVNSEFAIRLADTSKSGGGDVYTDYKAFPAGAVRVSGADIEAWLVHPGVYDAFLNVGGPQAWKPLGTVVVEPGKVAKLNTSEIKGHGTIRGTVTDSSGHRVSGVPLQATLDRLNGREPGYPRLSTTTDDSGGFSFANLDAGSWVVYPSSLGSRSASRVLVDVHGGQESKVAMILEPVGRIVGMVRRKGVPVEGAQVVIRPRGERFTTNVSKDCFTDRDGAFRCDAMAPGEYLAIAYAQRGQIAGRQGHVISVRPSLEARVEIDLECEGIDLSFSWHGSPVRDIYKADAFSLDGFRDLIVATHEAEVCARGCLDAGTWLVRVHRARDAGCPEMRNSGGCALALLEVPGNAPGHALAARLGEGSVVVHMGRGSAIESLPTAHLVSVGGIEPGFGPGVEFPIAFEDLPSGERRFLYLPSSSVVNLTGRSSSGQAIVKRIEIRDEAEVRIEWPIE